MDFLCTVRVWIFGIEALQQANQVQTYIPAVAIVEFCAPSVSPLVS